jgi:hypothetical protein
MSLSHSRHPIDVAHHPAIEPEVKRAILASWASDAAAVAARADLRRRRGATMWFPWTTSSPR